MSGADGETIVAHCDRSHHNDVAAGPYFAVGRGEVEQVAAGASPGVVESFGFKKREAREDANTFKPNTVFPRMPGHRHIDVMGKAEVTAQTGDIFLDQLLQTDDIGCSLRQKRHHSGEMMGALDVDIRKSKDWRRRTGGAHIVLGALLRFST